MFLRLGSSGREANDNSETQVRYSEVWLITFLLQFSATELACRLGISSAFTERSEKE